MDIRNLEQPDVEELQRKVEELKKRNPDITARVYDMSNVASAPVTLNDVWEKLCAIELRLSTAFNEHVLVNGIWRKP